jgi:hypothetical protein
MLLFSAPRGNVKHSLSSRMKRSRKNSNLPRDKRFEPWIAFRPKDGLFGSYPFITIGTAMRNPADGRCFVILSAQRSQQC